MPKTTNERYQSFLNRQIVEPIDKEQFKTLLQNVQHKNQQEARALCIILWTTAARPNEAVRLKREDISKKDSSLWVKLPGSKGSLARTIELPTRDELVKEFWQFASNFFEGLYIFPHFISKKHRARIQKKTRKGELKYYYGKDTGGYYIYETTLGYWFQKWFSLPPYVFRHNRLTIAAEKLNLNQLKQLKGAKTEASVWPYVNLTKKEAKRIGRELIK